MADQIDPNAEVRDSTNYLPDMPPQQSSFSQQAGFDSEASYSNNQASASWPTDQQPWQEQFHTAAKPPMGWIVLNAIIAVINLFGDGRLGSFISLAISIAAYYFTKKAIAVGSQQQAEKSCRFWRTVLIWNIFGGLIICLIFIIIGLLLVPLIF